MRRLPFLITLLALSAFIAAIHITALSRAWYFHYPWLDLGLHFAGGLLIGLVAAGAVFGVFGERWKHEKKLLTTVLAVLAVGILWEVFEVAAGVPREANWALDTKIDLLMDTLGGVFAAFLVRFAIR